MHILHASSSILTPPILTSPTNKSDSSKKNIPSVSDAGTRTKQLESRVLSSKTLATEVKTVLDHLRRIVEPPPDPPSEKTNHATSADVDQDDEDNDEDSDEESDAPETSPKRIPPNRDDSRSSDSDEAASSLHDDDDDSSVNRPGEQPQRSLETSPPSTGESFNANDAEGWESGSISPSSSPSKRAKLKHSVDNGTPSIANEDDNDEEDVDVDDDDASSDPDDDDDAALTSSRFLPSLNVGFTRGESDVSDWSGAEDDANAVDGKQRKNRRGQRARKACVKLNIYFLY